MKKLLPIIFAGLLLSSCSPFGSIPVVGLDSKGSPFSYKLRKNFFESQLASNLQHADNQIIPMLQRKTRKAGGWDLSEFSLGLKIHVVARLGVAKVRGKLGASAIFEKVSR